MNRWTPSVRRSSASIWSLPSGGCGSIQQALLRGDQRALAVDADRAALEHHRTTRSAESRGCRAASRRPPHPGPREESLTPRVEPEVDAGDAARRPSVTKSARSRASTSRRSASRPPRRSPLHAAEPERLPGVATIGTGSKAAIALAVAAYSRKPPPRTVPQRRTRGPGHEAALVGRPLGRHLQPRLSAWCAS